MWSIRSTVQSASSARNIDSSDRQKPWQAFAAAQIGQWFSTST
jgi:hypothetical protein